MYDSHQSQFTKNNFHLKHTFGLNVWNSASQLGSVESGATTMKGPRTPM